MTIKEAILQSLEDLDGVVTHLDVLKNITDKKYCEFKGKTPDSTISAQLGDFIRNGDARVKRIKQSGGTFSYYLARKESEISLDIISGSTENLSSEIKVVSKEKTFNERSLHKLLSSFLNSTKVYSKTIFHEQSVYNKDSNQIWTHPDMVGVRFLKVHNKAAGSLLKSVGRTDMFELSSYEIKREINSDAELKKAFFQAVSNSSWANNGYLVTFEIRETLLEEMERLNQSFGIGVIKLNSYPYKSDVLFPAKSNSLDFKTIDKLCTVNKEFERFIEQIDNLMTADDRYYKSTEKELVNFCDKYFENDSEIEVYCKEKFIPYDPNLFTDSIQV